MLEIKNLSLSFLDNPNKKVVNDVNFTVKSGETVALVGESGSGKSLTALSISRLLPGGVQITDGSISLKGDDLFRLSNFEMVKLRGSEIGMIFQEAQACLNPVIKNKPPIFSSRSLCSTNARTYRRLIRRAVTMLSGCFTFVRKRNN